MKHASLRLGALALSSQRLNKGLLLLAGLTLLLTSTSYWAVSRLVEAEQDKVEFHFARVIENIHEHETFLRNVASAYDRTNHSLLADVQPASTTALGSDGHRELFQGRALPLSLPFTLAYDSRLTSMETRGALSLGTQLTDYYSTYWAGSYYASPQMFVFAPNAQFDIAVPGIDGTRQRLPLRQAQYLEIAGRCVSNCSHSGRCSAARGCAGYGRHRACTALPRRWSRASVSTCLPASCPHGRNRA